MDYRELSTARNFDFVAAALVAAALAEYIRWTALD